jgi:capsular exopolysaccharide synthesis family protein
MDGIQPYNAAHARTPAIPAPMPAHHVHPFNPAAHQPAKSMSDYVRALKRRIWLVLAVGVPLAVSAAVLTVRMPSVYRAIAQIQIEPPEFDPMVTALVSNGLGTHSQTATEMYVPTKIAQLKSKELIESVLSTPDFAGPGGTVGERAAEVLENLQTRQITGSTSFLVTLEGTDPSRTAKLLYALIERLKAETHQESHRVTDRSRELANNHLLKMKNELQATNGSIERILLDSKVIGPGGKNMIEEEYLAKRQALEAAQVKKSDLRVHAMTAQAMPSGRDPEAAARDSARAELLREQRTVERRYNAMLRRTVNKHDPYLRVLREKVESYDEQIQSMRDEEGNQPANPYVELFSQLHREEAQKIERMAEELAKQLTKVQLSAPEHHRYQQLQDEKKRQMDAIADQEKRIREFDSLEQSQKDAITIPASVAEPVTPVRPKRALFIAAGLFFSFGLGIGLVCLLERLDHTVKVPEHLSHGLALPLLGVVPRIRRTALTHRGGHLWTPGAPESIEADAYRNLRAGLLGAIDRIGPICTLLVTSAKAGEGKSTTALNLAATCARAGERTLLIDIDLRRPSLGDVFEHEGPTIGLVDVLRGEQPWQRTLVRTGLPNLDFMATGDTRDTPIEILGTMELRQLLIAVSGNYDRVILDGPAVLGMADCRMLGRVVDAAVLVVRSGSHGLSPVLRAKLMLEQSHVTLAGVIFNGLFEDLENWSSYGPYEPYGSMSSSSWRPAGRLVAPAMTAANEAHSA